MARGRVTLWKMQVRMLVLAGIAGACGWVARGIVALPEATAQPPRPQVVVATPPMIQVVMAPEPPAPVAEEEPEAEPEDDEAPAEGTGEDLGEVIARAQLHVAEHNSIYGTVTDDRSGELLAGVTVVVSGPQLAGSQVAITDETGYFKIPDLPTGYVLVTYYYADHTLERDNVLVSSLDPTPAFQRMDLSYPDRLIVIDDDIRKLPVPGRTFEAALDEASGSQGDELEISFSSGSSIENTYVIE